MKKRCTIILALLIFIMSGCRANTTQSDMPDCVVSNTSNDEYTLTIIANQENIEDNETFAKELIEHVRNNDFKTILFSYDETGYPTRLEMTVYLNYKKWENRDSFMDVLFEQENILDGYNIVEHYDKFHLEVK